MVNHEACILAIDCGTQSIRAILFDLKGNEVAKSQIPIIPYTSPKPGWAEQDPNYFWEQLCRACQTLWQSSRIAKDAIKGVTLTTQRGTVINLDRQGRPLRPAMVWLDQRKTHNPKSVGGLWGLLFKLARVESTIHYLQCEAEANWILTHQPSIWQKTNQFCLLSGFLTQRLTGEFVDSKGAQVGYLPFDYKTQQWASKHDWRWRALAVKPETLPKLISPTLPLGEITSTAAQATGIPKGLPLIAAGADKACEVLGSGCLTEHVGCLSYGTTATINLNTPRYFEPIRLLPPYPSAIPNYYCPEIQVYRGYWMVNWFKQQFGHPEKLKAKELGVTAEALFDDLVRAVPPGSMGLMLQPYWSPGIKTPGPEAKGAMIGFGDVHTRAHVYRAILEGLAYALREGREQIESRGALTLDHLRVSGGGSQSDAAMQITADMFSLPCNRSQSHETSALGAAMVGAVGLGLHPNFKSAVARMSHTRDAFEPNLKTAALYDALFHRVYKKMYPKLKSLYHAIQEITGYPKQP